MVVGCQPPVRLARSACPWAWRRRWQPTLSSENISVIGRQLEPTVVVPEHLGEEHSDLRAPMPAGLSTSKARWWQSSSSSRMSDRRPLVFQRHVAIAAHAERDEQLVLLLRAAPSRKNSRMAGRLLT